MCRMPCSGCNLRIKDSGGLHPGIWRFEAYGNRVAGTQDYTLIRR